MEVKKIIEELVDTFLKAGELSISLRDKGLKKEIKSDNTPVSNGDLEVNKFITKKISEITPEIPIISEETSDNKNNSTLKDFWLVDPIDGTYDYINDLEEFTINAGLIINNKPVAGLINAPAKRRMFYAYGKPDIIDINFGCPVKKVVCKGAGAGILKDIPMMVKLTEAIAKRTKIPLTVKTRLGWDHNSIKIVDVAERLQDVGCAAISIHGRTRAQMYKGDADWSYISKVKNNPRMYIPVFGNGDVNTPERAIEMRDKYGLDGAMIGRASIGNPWFFNQVKHFFKTKTHLPEPTIKERIQMAEKHLKMAIKWKGEKLGVLETRRHYSNYFKGIPDFKQYKTIMVTSDYSDDIFSLFSDLKSKFKEHELAC